MTSGKSHRPSFLPTHHRQHLLLLLFLFLLLLLHLLLLPAYGAGSSPVKFTPVDNYLIDCGSPTATKLDDGRTFKSDSQSSPYLSTSENIKATATSDDDTASSSSYPFLPLYLSARIFPDRSTYSFFVSKPGRHWIRLHFFPMRNPDYNFTGAVFTVTTNDVVLLHDFSCPTHVPVLKEYLLVVKDDRISLVFTPRKNSIAFINAIEVVSAPNSLIQPAGTGISPQGDFAGLSNYAFEVSHRVNVGGPSIPPAEDALSRVWALDTPFLRTPASATNVSVRARSVKYPDDGVVDPLVAPNLVYATAEQMADVNVSDQNFNITWEFPVDKTFSYLVRLHFCDIVSKAPNDLYFDVYLNGFVGVANLDLSTITTGLSVAYFKDFVVNSTTIANSNIRVQIGPATKEGSGTANAILNGLEVMKMRNAAGSLDGMYSVDGTYRGADPAAKLKKILAAVGLSMAILALVFLAIVFYRWRRRPVDWERKGSFSTWLLPIHASHSTFTTIYSKGGGGTNRRFSSKKSKSSSAYFSSALGIGRYFSFAELQEGTKNFDEKAVLGVGGFGKVYLAQLEDGTQLAVKRGNPSSEQGITEFQTEIQMLSKLRHRHLVSLIGYCDENTEMILVYEYMANGPLRDHLYGSGSQTPLSWKQRLEVCIGAARGLHYLHTGAAQGIIHRDVKTTNILLDEALVAKVADFGLSKAAPSMEQTHVSTAVKGSFGYLDPEYFRRQQLTDKSDVYSFGVVLIEVLCARPAINPALPRDQVNLAEWAIKWHRKGILDKIIDPHLAGDIRPASLKKYVEAAEKCLAEYGVDRPSMGDVLWNLEYALQLQETAKGQVDDDPGESSSKDIELQPLASIKEHEAVAFDEDGGGDGNGEDREVGTTSSSRLVHGR